MATHAVGAVAGSASTFSASGASARPFTFRPILLDAEWSPMVLMSASWTPFVALAAEWRPDEQEAGNY